jgi:DNA-binding CsgD family transcriptional regulator
VDVSEHAPDLFQRFDAAPRARNVRRTLPKRSELRPLLSRRGDPLLTALLREKQSTRSSVSRGREAKGIVLSAHLTPALIKKWGGPGPARVGIHLPGNRVLMGPRPRGVVSWHDKVLLLGEPPHVVARQVRMALEQDGPVATEQVCGPATLLGNLAKLTDPASPPDARWTAARRLARAAKSGHKKRHVQRAILDRAREERRSPRNLFRDNLFPEGLLSAAAAALEPRRIRLGKHYLKSALDGKVALVPPASLPPGMFAWWARATAYTYVAGSVARLDADLQDAALPLAERDAPAEDHPPASLVAVEQADDGSGGARAVLEAIGRLESVVSDRLTPRQREVLVLLGQGLRRDQVAAVLGCARSTVDVHFRDLKTRLKTVTQRV